MSLMRNRTTAPVSRGTFFDGNMVRSRRLPSPGDERGGLRFTGGDLATTHKIRARGCVPRQRVSLFGRDKALSLCYGGRAYNDMKSRIAIIAHRGFSGKYTENTMPAIRAALRLGVDFVEVDVHESKDGQLVVFHDYGLERICGVRGRLRAKTLAELKRLPPPIPTLREVLLACRGKARVLIEIKRADPRKVAALIERCHMETEVIVFSLSVRRMQLLAAANPRIRRFLVIAKQWPRHLPLRISGLGASRRLVRSRSDVTGVHRRGWKLFVWTVNRPADMQRLAAWGVDGLITDRPDRAKSCLAPR